jgi:hypothetical protein
VESFTPEELAMIERTSEALRQYPHLRRAFIRALQMEELFAIPEQLESLKQVVLELAAQYKQQQEQLNRIEQTANRALEVAERAHQTSERALQVAIETGSPNARSKHPSAPRGLLNTPCRSPSKRAISSTICKSD